MSWKPSFSEAISRRNVLKGATAAGAGVALGAAVLPGSGVLAQDASPTASPEASPAGAMVDVTSTEPKQTYPLTTDKPTLKVTIAASAFVQDFATNEFTK